MSTDKRSIYQRYYTSCPEHAISPTHDQTVRSLPQRFELPRCPECQRRTREAIIAHHPLPRVPKPRFQFWYERRKANTYRQPYAYDSLGRRPFSAMGGGLDPGGADAWAWKQKLDQWNSAAQAWPEFAHADNCDYAESA